VQKVVGIGSVSVKANLQGGLGRNIEGLHEIMYLFRILASPRGTGEGKLRPEQEKILAASYPA